MDKLFQIQKNFILNFVSGIKVCLCDSRTMALLSSTIPHSLFQVHDFFLFDYIHQRRSPIDNVSCVVVITPSSLKDLVSELSAPSYSRYFILFTGRIEPYVLEIIANSDSRSVVEQVHEIYIDALMQYDYLYLTENSTHLCELESLTSILMSLEITPQFVTQGDEFVNLANDLKFRCEEHNFCRTGIVVLLKRGFDTISPLLHDWHYQAAVEEHIEPEAGIIQMDGMKYTIRDEFFTRNRFRDIHTVGEDLKRVLAELEENKKRIENHEFEEIKEKARHALCANTHLKLHTAVVSACMERKGSSDAEIKMLIDGPLDIISQLKEKDIEEKILLLLLYFSRYVTDWEKESLRFPNERDAIMKFYRMFNPSKHIHKPVFAPGIDHKLGYEPYLKKIFKQIINGQKLHQPLSYLARSHEATGPIIIFIEGGIAMNEYRSVTEYARKHNKTVYFLSDKIFRIRSVLNYIMN